MAELQTSIKSIVSRLITDKPVRKTSYQVKGVLMKEFPDEALIPFINGSYRNDFLYPRIQVKILNEEIYLIGIKEGVEPVESIVHNLEIMNFGNITFQIENIKSKQIELDCGPTDKSINYGFLTPWIALNKINLKRYKTFSDKNGKEHLDFLRRLLSQNIAFIGKELGILLETKIFVDLTLDSLKPRIMDDGKAGAFDGNFQTNFVLPNYIGVGNGITKGFGVILSAFNHSTKDQDANISKLDIQNNQAFENLPDGWEENAIDPNDIPRSKRRKRLENKREKNEPNFNTAEYHSKTH